MDSLSHQNVVVVESLFESVRKFSHLFLSSDSISTINIFLPPQVIGYISALNVH